MQMRVVTPHAWTPVRGINACRHVCRFSGSSSQMSKDEKELPKSDYRSLGDGRMLEDEYATIRESYLVEHTIGGLGNGFADFRRHLSIQSYWRTDC